LIDQYRLELIQLGVATGPVILQDAGFGRVSAIREAGHYSRRYR